MTERLLEIDNVRCFIDSPRGVVRALDGVSLSVGAGRTLGLVGESGSGKSMLARSIMGIAPAGAQISGRILFEGVDLRAMPPGEARKKYWGRRIAMVFQDPMTSLNPVVRIGRQITESLRYHLGLGRSAAQSRAVDLLGKVGISDPERRLQQYPHQFSGGMRQRVTIAMALACDPDLLIADEATTALDVTVQKQILDLLQDLQRERGMSLILVSHDLGVVAQRTDDLAVMYGGRVVECAATKDLFAAYRHRYTEALFAAVPRLDLPPHSVLETIPGTPPDLAQRMPGCPFVPRCPVSVDRCATERPPMMPGGRAGHAHACYVPAHPEAVLAVGSEGQASR